MRQFEVEIFIAPFFMALCIAEKCTTSGNPPPNTRAGTLVEDGRFPERSALRFGPVPVFKESYFPGVFTSLEIKKSGHCL